MHELCHRCGAELPAGDGAPPFCPQCGAPQLTLSDYSEPLSTGSTTGTLPPPLPNPIDWQNAIRCAFAVAFVAAILNLIALRFDLASLLSTVWVLTASLTTLALYQRLRPLAAMNARLGARIGILVGVILDLFLATAQTIGALLLRFGLHKRNEFDDMADMMNAQWTQLAATRSIDPSALALIHSSEFRTTMMLIVVGAGLVMILLFSVLGGALGGLLRARRRSAI
jgi:hypothetical protein